MDKQLAPCGVRVTVGLVVVPAWGSARSGGASWQDDGLSRGVIAGVAGMLLALLVAATLPHGDARLAGDSTAQDAPVLAHVLTAAGCALPATRVGDCGTVAGFSGWYGSWSTAGDLGAYCLEHAKSEPRPALAYSHHQSARGIVTAPVETQQRLGYLLGRYGGSDDATTAAALAILVHAGEGDTLTTEQLAGYQTSLPTSVRSRVLALWQESAELRGPYAASMSITLQGRTATGVLTLRSATGHPVPGMPVSWDGSPAGTASTRTDASGSARLSVVGSGSDAASVTMKASVSGLPQDDFAVWVPHDATVQSVAVPLPGVSVSASASASLAAVTGAVDIVKQTDDPGFVGPGGAVFTLLDDAGATVSVVTTDASGDAPEIGALVPGSYTVVEQTPCAGCALAAPLPVTVPPGGTVTATVTDHAQPHQLTLQKSAPDGEPLAGAVLHARGQSAPGGDYDQDLGTCTTAADGTCQLSGGNLLAPQIVAVTEESPAPGTAPADPSVQLADLTQG